VRVLVSFVTLDFWQSPPTYRVVTDTSSWKVIANWRRWHDLTPDVRSWTRNDDVASQIYYQKRTAPVSRPGERRFFTVHRTSTDPRMDPLSDRQTTSTCAFSARQISHVTTATPAGIPSSSSSSFVVAGDVSAASSVSVPRRSAPGPGGRCAAGASL